MANEEKFDFAGWATRNNLKCSDGRIIGKDAFKDCDGKVVPLVWNHQHDSMSNVLGHALLINDPDGVITYGKFNDSKEGQEAKLRVMNGDITSLSIYANQLKQDGSVVRHGAIREVSLVLAGANPGAYIEDVMCHSDTDELEGIMYTGEDIVLADDEAEDDSLAHADEKTVSDVFNAMSEEKKNVVYALVDMAIKAAKEGK